MGGKLFLVSHLFDDNERLDKTTFNNVVSFLTSKLSDYNVKHKVVPYITEKTTFGDIDIIIEPTDINILRTIVGQHVPHLRNSNIHSFLYKHKYQIDFIFAEKEKFDMTSFFYGYNDFAWIILKLIERHNNYIMKDTGLYYKYHSNYKDHLIFLTDDPCDILKICQLDPEIYKLGFETYTAMFDYISNCPTFSSSIYALENMSHNNRKVYKKRKTYKELMKWFDKHNIPEFIPGKLISARVKFSNIVEHQISQIEDEYASKMSFKQSFNGNIVNEITGLKHHELGKFMAYIRKKYTDEELIVNAINIIKAEFNKGNM